MSIEFSRLAWLPGYLMLLQGLAWGQAGSGTITGVVRDRSESGIPAASIKVVNVETGVATAAVTNEAGAFRLSALLPGQYRSEASATAFDTQVKTGVALSTGQTIAVDFTLQVGEPRQTVNVESGSGAAETQSSSLAQVVDHALIEK